ncbi:MAG: GIY-YIG nuclease family protein [Candidatus Omnitrophota bacterium]|nr:MAG: GIY-YIG nuclease family protein [Candidatus Omnitrophota bacterium]
MYYYVYVLHSQKDDKLYTGFTDDLKRRLKEHNAGEEPSTRHRIPFELIYCEACIEKKDAIAREQYLKSGKGKKYLNGRLRQYLECFGKVRF